MSDISKIDKNFKVETKIEKNDIKFISALEDCFDIYGLMNTNGEFHRMPRSVAAATNDGVRVLNEHSAGGRIRFKTNSKYVAINAIVSEGQGKMAHITMVGSSGFDMYLIENGKAVYYKSFLPVHNFGSQFEQIVEFPDNTEHDILIHTPLYNTCKNLYIGVQESAYVKPGSKYKYEKPIVYLGSSITQGGCASRPGNAYQGFVSRYFDTNYINLGFSGSCRGEQSICDYVPTLDMSIFVLDYDHNAPTPEHLENTHEHLFLEFRKVQPDTPVIIMSMTDIPRPAGADTNIYRRRDIVKRTYENAVTAGDKNVYFIDGQEVFKIAGGEDCTVDGCHPNDLGFWCMSRALIKVIEENKLLG